jgi:hypothetical protein
MRDDKNSSRKRFLVQQDEHNQPNHISDSTTQVDQDHVATGVLLVLGTNNSTNQTKHPKCTTKNRAACYYATTVKPMAPTGQTDGTGQTSGLHRSGRWGTTCEQLSSRKPQ